MARGASNTLVEQTTEHTAELQKAPTCSTPKNRQVQTGRAAWSPMLVLFGLILDTGVFCRHADAAAAAGHKQAFSCLLGSWVICAGESCSNAGVPPASL